MTGTGRYSAGAMILHWLTAIAVIANWQLAENADDDNGLIGVHAALGMTILALTLLRILWRLTHKAPSRAHLKWWERALASTVHTLFYVLLITMPLLGWIGFSAEGYRITLFGADLPLLRIGSGEAGEEIGEEALDLHESLGGLLLVLIALHVLGALKHTVFDRDGTLWKMLPFGRVRTDAPPQ